MGWIRKEICIYIFSSWVKKMMQKFILFNFFLNQQFTSSLRSKDIKFSHSLQAVVWNITGHHNDVFSVGSIELDLQKRWTVEARGNILCRKALQKNKVSKTVDTIHTKLQGESYGKKWNSMSPMALYCSSSFHPAYKTSCFQVCSKY